jgi:hypothetical protein
MNKDFQGPSEPEAPEYTHEQLAGNLTYCVLALKEANEEKIRLRKQVLAQRTLLLRCQETLGKYVTQEMDNHRRAGDNGAWELWREINSQLNQVSPFDYTQEKIIP